jgi:uncharacterized protein YbjT (DUF2867 family)
MKALITGASGLIGTHCLNDLLSDKDYPEIEIWVRKPTGISHPKLTELLIDFDQISQMPSTNAEHVFCCMGTTIKKAGSKEVFSKIDKDYVAEMAKLAERSGSKCFLVVSSIGADSKSGNFYLRTKGEMEEIKKKIHPINLYIPTFNASGKKKRKQVWRTAGKSLHARASVPVYW